MLVGVIAPNVLSGYYELGIVLVVAALLGFVRVMRLPVWALAAAGVVLIGTTIVVWNGVTGYASQARVMVRNFYGVVRTRDFQDPVPYRAMYHGGIMHGGQLLEPDAQMQASSYFGPTSGYGRLFASLPPAPRNVGVIGLGAGAIAVYGRAGDHFVFYEIDPQVIDVAQREFTFLGLSKAKVETVLGDGRLSLERAPDGYFDVLAMDAFSGDAIPMHLLTREAMAMYVRKLKPDGAIIFQATNRFVNIQPVVSQLAAEHGMKAVLVSDSPEATEGREYSARAHRSDHRLAQPAHPGRRADQVRRRAHRAADGLPRLDRRLLQPARRAQVALPVCWAVQHAAARDRARRRFSRPFPQAYPQLLWIARAPGLTPPASAGRRPRCRAAASRPRSPSG